MSPVLIAGSNQTPHGGSGRALGNGTKQRPALSPNSVDNWREYIAIFPSIGKQGPVGNSSAARETGENDRSTTVLPYGRTTPSNELIPLYCAIMGLVIIGLVFYVIYKHWRQRQAGAAGKLTSNQSSVPGVGFAGLPTKASHHKRGGQEKPLLRGVVAVCSPSALQDQRKAPATCRPEECMYRDLPEKHRNRIEAGLVEKKSGSGWKELAHELGYAQAEISAYESGDSVVSTVIRKILIDWAARDTATLAELGRALQAVGQRDILALVFPGSGDNNPICTDMGHV